MFRRAAILAGVMLGAGAAGAQPVPSHPDLTYAVVGGTPLRLDLYLPSTGAAPHPCVVRIHGGGWQSGSRYPLPSFGVRLLERGIAVASVSYRLTSQAGQFGGEPVIYPAQIHDVKGAVRWLRANAATYGLDPERFGAWGTSAGAHLAALLGVGAGVAELEGDVGGNLGQPSHVSAWVDYFGPSDFFTIGDFPSALDHDAPTSPESRLIGWDDAGQGLGDVKANLANPSPPYPALVRLMELASPERLVDALDAPAFVAHGSADATVPAQQSEILAQALASHGVFVDHRVIAGAGHGFLGNATDSAAVVFLQRELYRGVAAADQPTAPLTPIVWPNPARGPVRISAASSSRATRVEVLDLQGRGVRSGTLTDGTWLWDARDAAGRRAAPGVYFVRIPAESGPARARRFVLID